MKSAFLANLHHAYAQTDGSYAFPNSREGDMLRTAKRELEQSEITRATLLNALARADADLLIWINSTGGKSVGCIRSDIQTAICDNS